ncbi:MarR family transcriptional regulator [Altererythrobacter salegens]|uniref:MarR family transcriptional regulator n=1 Tax=Croceibacterium salegens TaxID=1737568 RepID=A0A6I4SSQ3_9SPHN|nr:MarR family transcriptional regulator [Croceibacterium salegens]MXO58974.1 MarR family transcriptional regulator [Croceibacterium salegens]
MRGWTLVEADTDDRRLVLSEPEGRVGTLHRLLKLNNRLLAPFSTHLAHRYAISLNEFRLLMAIGRLGASASHELAEHTGVNAMSVSRAVSTLERHGRITVETDPANRRRKVLRLTGEGERLYEVMLPHTQVVADYLLRGMADEDLATLDAILGKLIARLEATDTEGRSQFIEETKPAGEG